MQNILPSVQVPTPHAIALGFASGSSMSSRYLHLGENILHYCLLKHEITVYYYSDIQISSSETAWPIKAKLHMEHPWEGGKKVYINGQGHMTKMAAMAVNSKNL